MAHLTRPAEISGVSAGSFPETAAGNRAYIERCARFSNQSENTVLEGITVNSEQAVKFTCLNHIITSFQI